MKFILDSSDPIIKSHVNEYYRKDGSRVHEHDTSVQKRPVVEPSRTVRTGIPPVADKRSMDKWLETAKPGDSRTFKNPELGGKEREKLNGLNREQFTVEDGGNGSITVTRK